MTPNIRYQDTPLDHPRRDRDAPRRPERLPRLTGRFFAPRSRRHRLSIPKSISATISHATPKPESRSTTSSLWTTHIRSNRAGQGVNAGRRPDDAGRQDRNDRDRVRIRRLQVRVTIGCFFKHADKVHSPGVQAIAAAACQAATAIINCITSGHLGPAETLFCP